MTLRKAAPKISFIVVIRIQQELYFGIRAGIVSSEISQDLS